MINVKKKLASAAIAAALVGGSGIALAAPAQAASYQTYWFGTKSACDAGLKKAMPGFGSFVRLSHGCIPNGNGYAYRVAYLS